MDKTTVSISLETAKRIDRISKGNGISKRELLDKTFEYLGRNGINPVEHESPISEIQKVTKRLDQFFAFFKKQEKDLLIPVFAKADETNVLSKDLAKSKELGVLKTLAKADKLDELLRRYNSIDENVTRIRNHLLEQRTKIENSEKKTRDMIAEMLKVVVSKDRHRDELDRIRNEY